MRRIALIRNLNQGHRGHVSTADLIAAFDDAGSRNITPFQSNGTVVFSGDAALATDAMSALSAHGRRAGYFRARLRELADIINTHGWVKDAARRELTLHAPLLLPLDERAAREGAARRCRLLDTAVG